MYRILACVGLVAWSVAMTGGPVAAQPSNATVIASGLNGPRGLKFGPDGNLYIAEAGTGGTNSTAGACDQVPAPIGPYTGGNTARISMIRRDGTRSIVADQLPSTQDAIGDLLGVADVAFVGNDLYALIAGGGCSHGNPDSPNSVIKIDRKTGTWTQVADISQFVMTHPVAAPNPPDFEPDEVPYSMTAVGGKLYVVGPNHGQVIEVKRNGALSQLIDTSATLGHIVPTAIVFHGGTFQVGNLGLFPVQPGSSQVLDISRKGAILSSAGGFTAIVGLAYHQKQLYALELSTDPGNPTPGTGKVVRLDPSGAVTDVVTGLSVPTAMTFGPDNNLYISNFGAAPAGTGEILQIPFDSAE
jgi:hypothetical protein